MTLQQEFVERARTRREELRYTQARLARMLGVTQATVSGWESGQHAMRLDDAAGVSKALQLPLWEMLRDDYVS